MNNQKVPKDSHPLSLYRVIQFLDLATAARGKMKAARNKAEQVGLPECARAIDTSLSNWDEAIGLVHGYQVHKAG